MTVREAFIKLGGEIPERATCHIGCDDETVGNPYPTIFIPREGLGTSDTTYYFASGHWEDTNDSVFGPDLSERPASSFLGLFGEEFDRVVGGDNA